MKRVSTHLAVPAFCLACGVFAVAPSRASIITLNDLNSQTTFDTQGTSGVAGQNDWHVDTVNQVFQQWFWFRIGNTPEQPLNALPQTAINVSDTNFNPGNDHLSVQYTGATLRFTTIYSLAGGAIGSGASDIGEQIKIDNLSASDPLDIHFFQYVDFDLNGTTGGDTVQVLNAPLYNTVQQTEGLSVLSETVLTPVPNHHEVNFFPVTVGELNDGLPTTLADTGGPLGPGDVTWAFEWDFIIAPHGSVIISKDKLLQVGNPTPPEPASLGLMLLGGALALRRRRRAA